MNKDKLPLDLLLGDLIIQLQERTSTYGKVLKKQFKDQVKPCQKSTETVLGYGNCRQTLSRVSANLKKAFERNCSFIILTLCRCKQIQRDTVRIRKKQRKKENIINILNLIQMLQLLWKLQVNRMRSSRKKKEKRKARLQVRNWRTSRVHRQWKWS